MDCIVSPQKSYVEALTPNVTIFNVTVFGDGAFKEVL